MKILYFGTVCDLNEYEKSLQKCKKKPSVATINFEMALLEGFKKNHIEMDVYSFPMIPTFPKSKYLVWGSNKQYLGCGYQCTWLKTINFPFIKQLSRKWDGRKILKKWLRDNGKEDSAVLIYSVPPFLAKDIIKYCNKYGVKCYAIVPDLVKNMYMNTKSSNVVKYIKNQYLKTALKYQSMFDGYIYLAEAMKEEINPEKPYVVMEGIANVDTFSQIPKVEKSEKFIIMYAGRLHEKYGIINLVEAVEMIDIPNVELWIFGDGSAAKDIEQRAKNNSKIYYWGRRPLHEILKYEKEATLLVNPRDPKEEYTKFSFPSKTIEYMLSGTPLLTTRLPGIPAEYYEYAFFVDDNASYSLKTKIEEIINQDREQLEKLGCNAMDFISKNKNSKMQVKRILDFIKSAEGYKSND